MSRPTGYQSEYAEELFNLMKQGKKGAEVFAHFNIHRKTFWDWKKKYPEFNEAYERGLEKCEAWWQQFGLQKMIEGDEKGYKYWKDFMHNNFDWNKNHNLTGNNTQINISNMNVFQDKNKQELIESIENMLKELPIIDASFETVPALESSSKDESTK